MPDAPSVRSDAALYWNFGILHSDAGGSSSLRIDEGWNRECDSSRKPIRDSDLVVDRAETPWSVT